MDDVLGTLKNVHYTRLLKQNSLKVEKIHFKEEFMKGSVSILSVLKS